MKFKKFLRLLTSKFLLVCLLLLLELAFLPTCIILTISWFPQIAPLIVLLIIALDIILCLYVINSEMNPEYKIAWIVTIMFFPVFGGLLFLMLRKRQAPRKRLKKLLHHLRSMDCLYKQNPPAAKRYAQRSEFAEQCASFITHESDLPAADCIESEYFSSGEEYFARLIEELKKAEKFIFMEYFIIAKGKFWDSVLEILKEKVHSGVDVRVIYDDIGSMFKVPSNYAQELENMGIKCLCFNRFRPVLDVAQNNRTHRKITVIDGSVAFTGGINLADEYINETHPYGHWKDTGVMIRGRAAQNFTAMFLQLWTLKSGDDDYTKFLSDCPEGDCLCIPFSDTPFDDSRKNGQHNICEDLYLKIIYHARKYVYINTPYLIIDGEMKRALITAARTGVDVRITVPDIPDKKYVFALTKAFYSQLIKEGIKIYRYTPGFIHAKSIVSDGKYSIIGSTNMDFRSFYLHCECDIMFFDEKMSEKLHQDYLDTCEKSELVTEDKIKVSLPRLIYRSILRIFAPLL